MTDVELKMGSIKTVMDPCGLEILCHTGHMDAQLTLQKFALRARRIAAHTLAADRERLSAMANTRLAGWIQSVDATPSCSSDCSCSANTSAGDFQSRTFRGRLLTASATASRSCAVQRERSVPFGKY